MSMQIPFIETLLHGDKKERRIEIEGVNLIMKAKDIQKARCIFECQKVKDGEVCFSITKNGEDLAKITMPKFMAEQSVAMLIVEAHGALK